MVYYSRTAAEDGVIADGEAVFADGAVGVAFDGVDAAVIDFFDDADVIGVAVLAACRGFDPVEKDDVAGVRDVGPVTPLTVGLEPADTDRTAYKGRDAAVMNVVALDGAPADEF